MSELFSPVEQNVSSVSEQLHLNMTIICDALEVLQDTAIIKHDDFSTLIDIEANIENGEDVSLLDEDGLEDQDVTFSLYVSAVTYLFDLCEINRPDELDELTSSYIVDSPRLQNAGVDVSDFSLKLANWIVLYSGTLVGAIEEVSEIEEQEYGHYTDYDLAKISQLEQKVEQVDLPADIAQFFHCVDYNEDFADLVA